MHDSSAQNVYCKVKRENQIEIAAPSCGIEFRCIQSRKYFEHSVSCRKCILCDRDSTGALGAKDSHFWAIPVPEIPAKIQIHRIQIQNQQPGGFVFFTSLIISSVGVVVFKVYNMIRQINLEMNGLLYRINPGVSKINSLLYRAHSW